jgi:hypothetical protein
MAPSVVGKGDGGGMEGTEGIGVEEFLEDVLQAANTAAPGKDR